MKAMYLDCFSGISGNMLLGAFLHAGVPLEYLEHELKRIDFPDIYHIHSCTVNKNGIQAVHMDVELPEQDNHIHTHENDHLDHKKPEHDHLHLHEDHHHTQSYNHNHEHAHRTFSDIRTLLINSHLSESVIEKSISIFNRLAEAEGSVHGRPKEDVAFHEVGAVDSIVDIVGAAICMDYMKIEKVFVSKVNTGSGYVHCAHGLMMVPAPATAELLKSFPTYKAGAEKELTTPTGAAIINTMAEYSESLPFSADLIAYGAGTMDLKIPNVLRIYIGEWQNKTESTKYLLETNIDDMNPQIYGYLYECLLSAGALDVWTSPIYMKKNRPAHTLSLLVDEKKLATCTEIIMRETSTIGIRVFRLDDRVEAERTIETVKTKYGNIRCKISKYQGRTVSITPEYDDCRKIAIDSKVPLKLIQQEALLNHN